MGAEVSCPNCGEEVTVPFDNVKKVESAGYAEDYEGECHECGDSFSAYKG